MTLHVPSLIAPTDRPRPAACSEVFAAPDGAGAAFVRAHLSGPALWIQDRPSERETGRPWFAGWPLPVWTLRLSHPRDVLIAAEEALACRDLSAVVAEIHGNPAALSFTASRRLAIRAEASGVALWLIRNAARPDASAMRDRWQVATLPSAPHPDDPAAPGEPRWRVELVRSRDKRPAAWAVGHERGTIREAAAATGANPGGSSGDHAPDRLDFAPLLSDGTLAAPDRADGLRAAR